MAYPTLELKSTDHGCGWHFVLPTTAVLVRLMLSISLASHLLQELRTLRLQDGTREDYRDHVVDQQTAQNGSTRVAKTMMCFT